VTPAAQTVVQGGAAIITCQSQKAVIWKHNDKDLNNTGYYIYFNVSIIISSVSYTTIGKYTCLEPQGTYLMNLGTSLLNIAGKHTSYPFIDNC